MYLIVFDWNGTLLSDTRACMDADNWVIKAFGGKKTTLKTYRDTVTIPAIDFYVKNGCNRELLEKKHLEVSKLFIEVYENRAAKCRLRKGARKLLEYLKRKNVKVAILSNHTMEGIINQLNRLGIRDLIDDILANDSAGKSFLARNKKNRLTDHLRGKSYKGIAIIGDSPEEIEIGKSLGFKTIAVSDGYYSNARLKSAGPDHLINSLEGLSRIFLEL